MIKRVAQLAIADGREVRQRIQGFSKNYHMYVPTASTTRETIHTRTSATTIIVIARPATGHPSLV